MEVRQKKFIRWLFPLCLLTVLGMIAVSCKKDDSNDIAREPVDFYLYLSDPLNIALNAVGGWVYVNAGTKGIIVYRRSQVDFTALERNCSFDPGAACSLVEVISGITAIDSCCTSRFSIYDGSVINGPANRPLYTYNTYFDGVVLRIYN